MTSRLRRRAALLTVLGVTVAAPAPAAFAATATVTGDGGTPVSLGGAVSLRHMKPDINFAFAPDEKRYAVSIVAPDGSAASSGTSCTSVQSNFPERVRFLGNGDYTVSLKVSKNADDNACAEAVEQRFTFKIAVSTVITPPGGALLTRRPGEFGSISYDVPVDINPGADSFDFRYSANPVLSPDGGLSEPFASTSVNLETGRAAVSFTKPGRYTFVARAKTFRTEVPGPWSPRVEVNVLAPFDLLTTSFPDARGPSYQLSAQIREATATGKVKVSIAKGKTGKKFRRLGTAKISKGGKFKLRFKLRTFGFYKLRYQYAGSATTASGTVTEVIRIRKTFF